MSTKRISQVIVSAEEVTAKITNLLAYLLKRRPSEIECVDFLEYRLQVMTTLSFGRKHCLPLAVLDITVLDGLIYEMYTHTNWALLKMCYATELITHMVPKALLFTTMESLTHDHQIYHTPV